MAYDLPQVADFRARFPEFSTLGDPLIQMLLDEGAKNVDTSWVESDYAPAIMYYAGHLALAAQRSASFGQIASLGQEVRSIAFRDRTITFHRAQDGGGAGGKNEPNELDSTFYGQQYMVRLIRNVPPVLIF